jgi:2-polyprenyl-3-methyl-5-hydroxy-6-metoxy-1,4-benzoquinol methylase
LELRALAHFLSHVIPFTAYPYKGEMAACNLCGSDTTLDICGKDRRWKKLGTVVCAECGLMRTQPMPNDTELEAYYRSEYRADYQMASSVPPRFHTTRSMRDARARLARLDPYIQPGRRVLDFGCGSGEFLKLAQDRGCTVLGIEPGEVFARYARDTHGIDVINAPWQAVDLPDGQFDLITSNHVIEHLRAPVDAIGAMARWLAPGGALFLSVPDMRPNDRPAFERFHFAHVHGFVPATLQAAAGRHGLVPIDGESLTDTTAIFRHAHADEIAAPRPPPGLARALADGYPDASIADYVLSGRYFRAAGRRFRNWRRDTFRPAETTAGV